MKKRAAAAPSYTVEIELSMTIPIGFQPPKNPEKPWNREPIESSTVLKKVITLPFVPAAGLDLEIDPSAPDVVCHLMTVKWDSRRERFFAHASSVYDFDHTNLDEDFTDELFLEDLDLMLRNGFKIARAGQLKAIRSFCEKRPGHVGEAAVQHASRQREGRGRTSSR